MNSTVEDIVKFSFCPHYYEQDGEVDHLLSIGPIQKECLSLFRDFINFVFGKFLESGEKMSWTQCLSKWSKMHSECLSFRVSAEGHNQSLISLKAFYDWFTFLKGVPLAVGYNCHSELYGHVLNGMVPVVLLNEDKTVSLIFIEPLKSVLESRIWSIVRFGVLLSDQEVKVSGVYNLSYFDFGTKLAVTYFRPNSSYLDAALSDVVNVLQSMQDNLSYMNVIACSSCPIRGTCEAVNSGVSSGNISS